MGAAPAVADALLQFRCELLLLLDCLEDGSLALVELLELAVEFADTGDLHLVEVARPLLSVARYEGNGAPLVEQFQCGFYLVLADRQGVGDMLSVWIHLF